MFNGFKKHPAVRTDADAVKDILDRGTVEVIERAHLEEKLLSGERLRIKLGIDPTSPNIHLGRAIPLLKLRDFQELGHTVVFIIGDFTGLIGDASDKESERPMLSEEEVKANMETYFEQVGRILDMQRTEVQHNSKWLGELTYRQIGEQANLFALSDFIARENVRRRLDAGKRVSLREVLYPLMQGYDSVAIEASVEIGSTDQRFNMLAGRTMQDHFGQVPQDVLMTPLIAGTDGRKMSSSWGNTINITDAPEDMYGKVMRVTDDVVDDYFVLCTRVAQSEIEEMRRARESGALNPRDAKMRLAYEIVSLYHGESAAREAEQAFVGTFQKGEVPAEVPHAVVAAGADIALAAQKAGLVSSRSEFLRLLKEGAVKNTDTGETLSGETADESMTIKIGKRRFLRIDVAEE